jgi:hypothetical protein
MSANIRLCLPTASRGSSTCAGRAKKECDPSRWGDHGDRHGGMLKCDGATSARRGRCANIAKRCLLKTKNVALGNVSFPPQQSIRPVALTSASELRRPSVGSETATGRKETVRFGRSVCRSRRSQNSSKPKPNVRATPSWPSSASLSRLLQ